jgi:hypothetical protein
LVLEDLSENASIMERADRMIAAVTHRRHW